jgi:hypothetical protein
MLYALVTVGALLRVFAALNAVDYTMGMRCLRLPGARPSWPF